MRGAPSPSQASLVGIQDTLGDWASAESSAVRAVDRLALLARRGPGEAPSQPPFHLISGTGKREDLGPSITGSLLRRSSRKATLLLDGVRALRRPLVCRKRSASSTASTLKLASLACDRGQSARDDARRRVRGGVARIASSAWCVAATGQRGARRCRN